MAFRGAQNREWPVAMRPVFLCGLCRETAPKSKESETILEADGAGKRLEEKDQGNWREGQTCASECFVSGEK